MDSRDLTAVVRGVWAEVLAVPEIRMADNFFDLGGDSLKAMRATTIIYSKTGLNLPIDEMFICENLSEYVSALSRGPDSSTLEVRAE